MQGITKHAGGRPTKYDPSIIQKAEEYLSTCGREQTKLPKLTEFYRWIDITRETGDEWQNKYPEFSYTCKKIMELQQETLIDDGMYGGKEVNQAMAIFLLKANHGMVETSRTEVTGKDGEPIQLNITAQRGYVPTTTTVAPTSETSDAGEQPALQNASVASEGTQNNNSNI
jgi:hypothetical protein